MTSEGDRRRFLEMALCGTLAACAGGRESSSGAAPTPPPEGQVDKAIAQLDELARDLMERTGVPGMAVAVVRADQKVYAKGFGTPAGRHFLAGGCRYRIPARLAIEVCRQHGRGTAGRTRSRWHHLGHARAIAASLVRAQ